MPSPKRCVKHECAARGRQGACCHVDLRVAAPAAVDGSLVQQGLDKMEVGGYEAKQYYKGTPAVVWTLYSHVLHAAVVTQSTCDSICSVGDGVGWNGIAWRGACGGGVVSAHSVTASHVPMGMMLLRQEWTFCGIQSSCTA